MTNRPAMNRRVAVAAVVLGLLVVAAIMVAVMWPRRDAPARPDAPAAEDRAEPVAKQPHRASDPSPAPKPAPSANEVQRATEPAAEDAEKPRGLLVVRCVDPTGNPVPAVRLSWRTGLAGRTSNNDPTGNAQSNDAGEVAITGPFSHRAAIEVTDEAWYALPVEGLLSGIEPLRITVRPAVTIRFRAQYDDGQPVLYLGALDDRDREDRYSASFSLQDDRRATVKRVPVDAPLRCTVFAGQRAGYQTHREEVSVAQLTSGNELLVVVPKSGTLGSIRVEFLNGKTDHDGEWLIESEGWMPQRSSMGAGRPVFEKGGLRPGRYRVTILGKRAWQSDWLEVLAGDQTLVQANLLDGGTAKARLVDEFGVPVEGGVLRLPTGGYLKFSTAGRPWMVVQVSDAKGYITLSGLPPIPLTIEAEAFGKEIARKEVTGPAGGEFDVGDIVLSNGQGVVTVELVGMKQGHTYHVGLVQPKGSFCMEVKATGSTVKLEGIALRKYRVGIKPGEYGMVKLSEEFELTPGNPTHTLQIDVSSLEPMQIIRGEGK